MISLLGSDEANSKVIEFWSGNGKLDRFTSKEACIKHGFKNTLLTDVKNFSEIDCMGKPLKALKFCRDLKNESSYLLRGYALKEDNQVVCQYGSQVRLKVECSNKYKKLCNNEKQGCLSLGTVYASELSLDYYSLGVDNKAAGKVLRCHFSSPEELTLKNL
jgi:hypothetical protein